MIRLKDVEMEYDNGTRAIKGITLTIEDGEFVFLVGPSGSGKSTIIKLLTGEVEPCAGRIMINGFSVSNISEKQIPLMRRTLGVIFQDFRLIEKKTVYDNLAFVMRAVGASPKEIRKRIPYVLELVGLGTNVGCYGSILPSVENTRVLVELRDFLNRKYGFHIKTLSGGSTCTLKLLEEGRLPAGINHLRVGEGLLYGEDTTGMRFLEGYHTDAFHFKAQVVELRRKPSVPIGEHGRDGKGELPEYPDRGVHLRAICAAGKQDVAWAALTPTLPGAEMIGASSDHLIVDVEGCGGRVRVGDWLDFRCGYMAVLDATTSAYVDVREV